MSDQAIVNLVDSLPTLARDKPDLFEASAKLLLAQSHEKPWQNAMKWRLAIVRRTASGSRTEVCGEALAFKPRNDAWIGTKDASLGQWSIQDGRSLATFLRHGDDGRRALWNTLVALPSLTKIELPTKHLGQEAWAEAASKAGKFLQSNHLEVQQALYSGRTWGLAVRRIKRLGLRGLFDPDTQTVIVDPRHPETLSHELAHWVLGHHYRTDPLKAEKEVHVLLKECSEQR